MALWGGPSKGALLGRADLGQFSFSRALWRLCLCTYLALSNWQFTLCVQILYSFLFAAPNPTINMLLAELGFGMW